MSNTLKIEMSCYGLACLLDSSPSSVLASYETVLISIALVVLYVVKSPFIDIFMNDSLNFVSL